MMTRYFLILVFISGYYCEDQRPIVETPLGSIRGSVRTSQDGRKFAAFEGIPYAKPPIGKKRFEAPEPVKKWRGTWEATFLSHCSQLPMGETDPSGDEDCLHVNVYVPREEPVPGENLEVVVHIHGGGFMYGSGHHYGRPERPMDKDIVFVTFNYRVGILGFLSTEDVTVPGNNGLKDQALALRWVKENIASFGGNPDSITLTGLSAGGASVHLHYFSEQSRGLFHRGFSQSGLALNPWSLAEGSLGKARKLAETLGCPMEPSKALVDCLKEKPHKQIVERTKEFFVYKFLPCVPFGPVVEKGGAKPFLKEHPYEMLNRGQVLDVPWILSLTQHEGMFPVFMFEDYKHIDQHWDDLAPFFLEFTYTLPPPEWKTASRKIREHYFGTEEISKKNMLPLVQIFSDRLFFNDADTAALLQSEANKSPVYFFIFAYTGDNKKSKIVGHAAEIRYMFTGGILFPDEPLTADELRMKDALWDLVVSYATGDPTIAGVQLQPTGADRLTYFRVAGFTSDDVTPNTTDRLTDTGFWRQFKFAENENLFADPKDEL